MLVNFRKQFTDVNVQVTTRLLALHPRNVFRISRAVRRETVNVFLRIERDGIAGDGEASANAYYGENAADVAARLEAVAGFLKGCAVESPGDIAAIWEDGWGLLAPSRAAQCALDVALWDWLGNRHGRTVTELALGEKAKAVVSFATLGLAAPEEMEAKIAELAGFPMVKIKSDQSGDFSTARRVRVAMPEARIAIDANCAWGDLDLERAGAELGGIGVEFIEQPLPPERDGEIAGISARLPVPVMADESCVTAEDVARVAGSFTGFNIKLVKCGGLTPALRMARRGRELGLKTMVGCMLESSLLIAAGAVAAQVTDYADLDGAWLLADDPFDGWRFERGTLRPRDRSGLGVVRQVS
jgi:L-alanine-DL-glutamate epimerase-like enolase superfamily enzyme